MKHTKLPSLTKTELLTLQVNLGYKCNQICKHCHVDAGPHRKEMMDIKDIDLIPKIIDKYNIKTLDLTGGAPELHPQFRSLVKKATNLGVEVIDRCNLTILTEPGQEDLANFLQDNNVYIIASLPCYEEENVDKQRGYGVFKRSILGLELLNNYGYGKKNSNLKLSLVYNPQGATLPPEKKALEDKYRKMLYNLYNIEFTDLITITNMPIKRFKQYLKLNGELESYKELLLSSYNYKNLKLLMCRAMISVDWQGKIFDCDFNQQLGLSVSGDIQTLEDLYNKDYSPMGSKIVLGDHCYGCTAGAGSSCGGSLTN